MVFMLSFLFIYFGSKRSTLEVKNWLIISATRVFKGVLFVVFSSERNVKEWFRKHFWVLKYGLLISMKHIQAASAGIGKIEAVIGSVVK